jgi:hypothetical protein
MRDFKAISESLGYLLFIFAQNEANDGVFFL